MMKYVTAVLPVGFAWISHMKSPYKPTVQRVRTRVTVGKTFVVCLGAKNVPGMYIDSSAPQLPSSFEFRFKLPPKNEQPLTARNCRRIALPPNNYRRIELPPKKYRHILVWRFRQSRYRRKMKTRLFVIVAVVSIELRRTSDWTI